MISATARRALLAQNRQLLRSQFTPIVGGRARWAATSSSGTPPESVYVPGGPVYKGSVNDPTPFPTPSKAHGSHHWAFERLLAAGLVPLTGVAFVTSGSHYPVLDGVLALSLIVHSHIGFDSVVVDYLDTRKKPVIGQVAKWGLRAATTAALVGVYQFNTNDIGLTELIAKVWTA
ncbi:related to succinate dehydrogenase [ubiquinone] cytochrome b small subunit, mitochondrial precursor [Serendipita indica DSM 11827]|uniref:Succinate dehydrogenase [ubiquinone] cytochrome b small subunit n=1 Tax=Serendipita indica (strain DSM 11827) TaxID=1109443 RepID=G4TGT6_SERID|nr:related to succinate dehydrogenase [ubiquinone] cytochrome b small subunit, mitochondrial precursor [Serendipita indica DSM 11827]